jgi:hypothetical protein
MSPPGSTAKACSGTNPSQTDLLFVTLNKSEALFSPSTRTRDLALGPSLFHWESHEGERPSRFAGGWSGRSRRRGYQAVAWQPRCSGQKRSDRS